MEGNNKNFWKYIQIIEETILLSANHSSFIRVFIAVSASILRSIKWLTYQRINQTVAKEQNKAKRKKKKKKKKKKRRNKQKKNKERKKNKAKVRVKT